MTTNNQRNRKPPALWEDFCREHTGIVASLLRQFEFVAVQPRRNLNLLCDDGSVLEEDGARVHLMTGNALLLQHERIAQGYRKSGRFPLISVSDDVLIHGRGLSWLLEDLWSLVLEDLRRDIPLSEDGIYDLHRDFLRSMENYVYARNKREIILKDSYRRRLRYEKTSYAAELREFAAVSCDALYTSEHVVNTSFVFSSRLPGLADTPPDGWERVQWTFEEKFNTLEASSQVKGMTVYLLRPETDAPRWVATIRHKNLPGQPGGRRLVTGLVFFSRLLRDEFQAACTRASALLEGRHPALSAILRQDRHQLDRVRMQLLSFFASVIIFFDFAQGLSCDTEQILPDSDLHKIALNFGPHDEIYPELYAACGDASLREALREIIFSCLEKGPALDLSSASRALGSRQMEQMTTAGKTVMGELGAQAEASAYGVPPDPDEGKLDSAPALSDRRAGQIPFADYLTQVRCGMPSGGWTNEIAAFLFLMEDGIMSMNAYSDPEDDSLYCVAKAGEKATFALAEPIAAELPALALVERECWRLDLGHEEAVKRFVPLLVQEDGAALDQGAQQKLLDACSRLYRCGHSLTGWDFETVTEQRDPEKKRRQSSYLAQARAFLHMS